MIEIRKYIQQQIRKIKCFPDGTLQKRRKPYLRLKSSKNKKVFFDIFLSQLHTKYHNDKDRKRRLKMVDSLPDIFREKTFVCQEKKWIYKGSEGNIVIIGVFRKKEVSLQLLTLYPK